MTVIQTRQALPVAYTIGVPLWWGEGSKLVTWDGFKWVPQVVWRGPWVSTDDYFLGDMVFDDSWTMSCIVETTRDRPAPQPMGDPSWVSGLGEAPPWVADTYSASQLITGARYTPTIDGFITSMRVWIPVVDPLVEYRIVIVADPDTAPVFDANVINPSSVGWYTLPVNSKLFLSGRVLELFLVSTNTTSETNFSGAWDYRTPNNYASPGTGEIVQANKRQGFLSISKVDDDGGDRSAELATLKSGDVISVSGFVWTVQTNTDEGTYHDIEVLPQAQASDGVQTFSFSVYGQVPVDYVYITDHYIPMPGVQGAYSTSGYENLAFDENAYGVDFEVQEAAISSDWDLVAHSEVRA